MSKKFAAVLTLVAASGAALALDPCAAKCGKEWQAEKQTLITGLESRASQLDLETITCVDAFPEDQLAAAACIRPVNLRRAQAIQDYRRTLNELNTRAFDCYRSCQTSAQPQTIEAPSQTR
jgi:hypothetical protein